MAYNPTSYNSEVRYPSGIVFFGTAANKPQLDSSSLFTVDESNSRLVTPNLLLANGGTIGNTKSNDLLTLDSDGIATFSSGVIIQGDLTVNGSQIVINTENIVVEDNIITLSSGDFTSPSQDAGIEIFRGTSSMVSLLWDEGTDHWKYTNNGTNYYNLVGDSETQTLTNKTISGASNTFTNIPNSALTNNGAITLNPGTGLATGGSVALGGTVTVDLHLHNTIETAIADGDYIPFIDVTDVNRTKKESLADIAALFAGNGLTSANSVINVVGGTGITASANSIDIDATLISGRTAITTPDDAGTDYLLIWDDTDDSLKKITRSNLITGLGTMSNFVASGDSGLGQTISDGNVFKIAGGDGINTAASATDIVTVTVDLKANGGLVIETGEIAVNLSASAITGTLAIADGGTGATDAATARSNLGLAIGSNVQAYDADLSAIAALSNADGNIIVGNGSTWVAENGATARASLGLTIGTHVQAYDAGLTSIAGLTTAADRMIYTTGSDTYAVTTLTSFARTLLDDADAATARGTLNVDVAGTDNSTNVTLAGTLDYITISGQTITRNAIVLTTDVSGTLPIANGGTGATTQSGARTALGLGSLATLNTVGTSQIDAGAVTEVKRSRTIETVIGTATATKDIVLCNSASNFNLTLPTSPTTGQVVRVKNINTGAVTVTSTSNIDGTSGKTLYYQYEAMTFVYSGSTWYVV